MPLKFWHLKQFNIFENLDQDDLNSVTGQVRSEHYDKNEEIALPADDERRFFFLLRGRVKLVQVEPKTGKELILYIVRRGELFGVIAARDARYSKSYAAAMERCQVASMSESDFNRVISDKPEVCFKLNKEIGTRIVKIENRLEELLFRDVPTRLARLILRLCKEFPAQSNPDLIDLKLTQADIASLVGSTREMVSKLLNEFKREGWIDWKQQQIQILDRDALAEQAK